MKPEESLHFEEFPLPSRADWEARIEKELKGKPLDKLNWSPAAGIDMRPYWTAQDVPQSARSGKRNGNPWLVGEDIPSTEEKVANSQALQALQGGAQALCFSVHPHTDWELLFKDIHLDYIHLRLETSAHPAETLASFQEYTTGRYTSDQLNGSIWYPADPAPIFASHTSSIRTLPISAAALSDPVESLRSWLLEAVNTCDRLTDEGHDFDALNAQLLFELHLGNHYLVEIARVRALHLLWANVQKAWGSHTAAQPQLHLRIRPDALIEDKYLNMIRITAMGMAGVLGGCDVLWLPPAGKEGDAFTRRISRNVQHLLVMESHLDLVADPAGGSYYLEVLTQKLAEAAWKRLQQA